MGPDDNRKITAARAHDLDTSVCKPVSKLPLQLGSLH
jgi:hypothetical protein